MTFSRFDEHSSPLFKSLEILKFLDLVTFHLAVFMYKYHNQLLPSVFNSFFTKISQIHTYNTRLGAKQSYYLPKARTNERNSDLIVIVGKPQSSWGGWRWACLVFSARYFSFCIVNDWPELKGIQQDSFITDPTDVFCKTSFGKGKILPCNFFSLRKGENF